MEGAAQEAWEKAQRIIRASKAHQSFAQYQQDPVGFGEQLLGEFYTEDMKAIANSVRDNPVTIARSATDVGKSFMAARIAIWMLCCFPDSKIYITAAPPLENLKQILWGEIAAVSKRKPTLFTGFRMRRLAVIRSDKSFIQGVAIPMSGSAEEREAKFSGKHAPYLLFIVDEGDAVPDEVYKGIEGCMSGGTMVRLLVMFNPRAQVGPIYMREKNRQANVVELSAFSHPNVTSGKDIIPGAVTRETTVRRINMWTRPLALDEEVDAECFEVPDFLVGATAQALDGLPFPPLPKGPRKIVDPAFSYMVLGQYPSHSATQLISEVDIDNAFARWNAYVAVHGEKPPEGVRPIMSLDIAEYGTDYCVSWLRYGSFVAKPILWSGVDTDDTAVRGLDIYVKNNAQIIMVDGTGVGASIAPYIARNGREHDARAISVKVSERPSPVIKTDKGDFKILRDQLWYALAYWLKNDNGAMLPPDGLLKDELLAVDYEVKNGKFIVTPKDELRKRLKRSPDRADALALSFAPFERATWVRVGDGVVYDRWNDLNNDRPAQNSELSRNNTVVRRGMPAESDGQPEKPPYAVW